MRYAIFSDIHNNVSALERALRHTTDHGIDMRFCLGDVGVDSAVDLLRTKSVPTVFGNWETSNWRQLKAENQTWALELPPMIREKAFWLTHAGPFWPFKIQSLQDFTNNSYVRVKGNFFPYLHYDEDSLWGTIAVLTEANISIMFHGHTHRQLVWRFTRSNKLLRNDQKVLKLEQGETYVVGVGSVGLPYDGPGICYVVYDDAEQTVEMVRLI